LRKRLAPFLDPQPAACETEALTDLMRVGTGTAQRHRQVRVEERKATPAACQAKDLRRCNGTSASLHAGTLDVCYSLDADPQSLRQLARAIGCRASTRALVGWRNRCGARVSFEIERKFLVTGDAWRVAATEQLKLRQAYLTSDGKASIRVRVRDNRDATLTIKSRNAELRRLELEYSVPVLEAEAMIPLCRGSVIDFLLRVLAVTHRVRQLLPRDQSSVVQLVGEVGLGICLGLGSSGGTTGLDVWRRFLRRHDLILCRQNGKGRELSLSLDWLCKLLLEKPQRLLVLLTPSTLELGALLGFRVGRLPSFVVGALGFAFSCPFLPTRQEFRAVHARRLVVLRCCRLLLLGDRIAS